MNASPRPSEALTEGHPGDPCPCERCPGDPCPCEACLCELCPSDPSLCEFCPCEAYLCDPSLCELCLHGAFPYGVCPRGDRRPYEARRSRAGMCGARRYDPEMRDEPAFRIQTYGIQTYGTQTYGTQMYGAHLSGVRKACGERRARSACGERAHRPWALADRERAAHSHRAALSGRTGLPHEKPMMRSHPPGPATEEPATVRRPTDPCLLSGPDLRMRRPSGRNRLSRPNRPSGRNHPRDRNRQNHRNGPCRLDDQDDWADQDVQNGRNQIRRPNHDWLPRSVLRVRQP